MERLKAARIDDSGAGTKGWERECSGENAVSLVSGDPLRELACSEDRGLLASLDISSGLLRWLSGLNERREKGQKGVVSRMVPTDRQLS